MTGAVVAGAGATLAELEAHACAAGWQHGSTALRATPPPSAARSRRTPAACGCSLGAARAQLVGAEAALAGGALLSRVDGPLKDSTGYDLSG